MDHLDPALAYDYVSWTVLYALQDQLVTYGSGVGLHPGLAETMPTVSAQLQQAQINQPAIVGDVMPSGEYAAMTGDPALDCFESADALTRR